MTNGQIKTRSKTKTNQFKTDSMIPDHQNPIEILYKLKDEIDLIYRLVRLQANILGQIDERRSDRINHDDVDDEHHIYRVWRTKLSKLKPKQCGKRSYEYLFDLYRYLLKATDGCVCPSSSSSLTTKSTNIDNCHPMLVTKRSTRTRIMEEPGDVVVAKALLPRAGGRRKLFKCTVDNCKYVCKQIRSFKSHQKVHAYGTEGLYSCRLCSKKFIRQASLNHHLKLAHTDSDGVYPCNVNQCQASFANWELVRKHKIEVHEQRKVHQCDQCPRVYKTRSSLMSHQKGHDSLVCSVEGCSQIFATKLMLQSHIRNEHQPPKYKCDKCSQTFRRKAQFDRHQKVLNCTWMYRCHVPNCTEQYKQLKQLAQHTKTVHQCEPCFPCSWTDCTYRSHSLHLLNNHYRTHTGERPYPCGWPGCDWRFKTMWLLRTHRKIHLDERSYHCYWPDCSHRSNTAPSFRRHIMVHEKNERKRLLKLQLLSEIEEEEESNKTIITNSTVKVESEERVTITTTSAETINNNH